MPHGPPFSIIALRFKTHFLNQEDTPSNDNWLIQIHKLKLKVIHHSIPEISLSIYVEIHQLLCFFLREP